MNYLESVEIEGFWGDKRVVIGLNDDVNFLIGPNGSGKTTIINILSAALKADIPILDMPLFDRIYIKMKRIGSNIRPSVEVLKTFDETRGRLEIEYRIKEKASEPATIYKIGSPYEDRFYRAFPHRRTRHLRELGESLSQVLANMVEVNWLSVHRIPYGRQFAKDESFESEIDSKVHQISTHFSNYFSLLASKSEAETKRFQEHIFLSLLYQDKDWSTLFAQFSVDVNERKEVEDILRSFGIAPGRVKRGTSTHFKAVDAAQEHLSEKGILRLNDAIALSDAQRVHDVVEKWRELAAKKSEIFRPKVQFEEIINNMFIRKRLEFDERNQPRIITQSGKSFHPGVLSSGEKQLFIFLGETLLQEERPVVFISDEPELSLHVSWQNVLFRNVRRLNPNSQVISATHSPDIVGEFRDKVIQIEECIHDI